MKLSQFIMLSGVVALLVQPAMSSASTTTTSSSGSTCGASSEGQAPLNINVVFQLSSGDISSFSAQNPLFVFFKVPDGANSTLASTSYSHFSQFALSTKQATIEQLQNATAGINMGNTNYIILDMSAIPAIAMGVFIVSSAGMQDAIAWTKSMTVMQAAVLDNEFAVIAYNKEGQGANSSFAMSPRWSTEKADHLKVLFKSSIYLS